MLTKDQILAADDLPREEVPCPQWGGSVYVRSLTAEERDAFEASMIENRGKDAKANLRNLRARLAVLCTVDEQGNRLFTDDDAPALGKKSAAALSRIYNVATRLNALSSKDADELAGN